MYLSHYSSSRAQAFPIPKNSKIPGGFIYSPFYALKEALPWATKSSGLQQLLKQPIEVSLIPPRLARRAAHPLPVAHAQCHLLSLLNSAAGASLGPYELIAAE